MNINSNKNNVNNNNNYVNNSNNNNTKKHQLRNNLLLEVLTGSLGEKREYILSRSSPNKQVTTKLVEHICVVRWQTYWQTYCKQLYMFSNFLTFLFHAALNDSIFSSKECFLARESLLKLHKNQLTNNYQ